MSVPVQRLLSAPVLLAMLFGALLPAPGQSTRPPAQADRVAAHADLRASTRLTGHVPAWAAAANDAGAVPDDTSLRLTFVLARSAERQAAFAQLLADQQDPGSPSYRHWLTPQQIGILYGPTKHDLDALTGWLTGQGLVVVEVAPSRTFVHVEATAGTVAAALSTSFRYFNLSGTSEDKPRMAATAEPAIPSAFAPLVQAISGLADVPFHPLHHMELAPMPKAPATPAPLGTSTTTGKHYIAPADFAVLYNLTPLYQGGYNGSNQKIAIIGRSRVDPGDISIFESSTKLPAKQPNTIVPPNGVDPGITHTSDQDESTLDVDRVFGTAPGAQADLIVATGGSGGLQAGAQYNIQTLLDPVMTISYGSCEASSGGQSTVTFWDTLFSQAAAEGISVFISSGDAGAAGCQAGGDALSANQPRAINALCASSYATCVGGTEFADTASPSTYWNSTNSSNLETAISYIPEGAWNEPNGSQAGTYVASATGGGASNFVAKPAWQTGVGVPADGARDVPDISFSSSLHNGYLVCLTYKGADCVTVVTFFGGTSAAAPGMAGVAALLNQKTGGSQGNLNPLLYRLAASTPAAFHDATPATSGVNGCDVGTPSMCNNSVPAASSLTGGLAGYPLTTGYDLATGLGSLNVNAFVAAFASTATIGLGPASHTVTLKAGAASGNTDAIAVNSQVYAGNVSLGCSVSFNGPGTAASTPICNLNPATVTIAANGTVTSTLSISTTQPQVLQSPTAASLSRAAPLLETGSVKPSNRPEAAASQVARRLTGPLGLALSSGLLLAFLPGRRRTRTFRPLAAVVLLLGSLGALSACSGSSTPVSPNPLLISASYTTLVPSAPIVFAGATDTLTATVANIGFNTTVAPSGTVQFFFGGAAAPSASVPVSGGIATAAIPFPSPGNFNIYAVYSGDSNFSGSNSTAANVTAEPVGTTAGNYTVTINASTAGGPTASTTVALTVQ